MKTTFEIEAAHRDVLRAAGLDSFDALLLAAASGPAASRHAYRETVPLEILANGQRHQYFLKRVFKVPPRHAIAPRLRLRAAYSQPGNEWQMLGALSKASIPAMQRAAWGELRKWSRPLKALLLVEAVSIPDTLENWLVPGFPRPMNRTAAIQQDLLHELGKLIGRIHDRGFRWPDMQAKHIYAERTTSDSGRFAWHFQIIDVERMTALKSNSNTDAVRSAMRDVRGLFRSLRPMPITADDLESFWTGYMAAGAAFISALDADLKRALPQSIFANPHPRLPDGYQHPRAAPLLRSGEVYLDPTIQTLFANSNLHTLEAVFSDRSLESLSKRGLPSYRDRNRICLQLESGGQLICYLKRYRHPPRKEQLRRAYEHDRRDSSAKREVYFIRKLTELGIPTLHTLAWGQEMSGIWEQRSFIITSELRGQSLEKLVAAASADRSLVPSFEKRREIIHQLGLIVGLLHRSRLFHRDLYLSHVFLNTNADGNVVLHLIDLARVIEKPRIPNRWIIKDLAALAYSSPAPLVTRADRLRFMYYYLRCMSGGVSETRLRNLLRGIRRRVARMARHDAHRRVRLQESPA